MIAIVGAITVVMAIVLYLVFRRLFRMNASREEITSADVARIPRYVCPKCNFEMEPGFVMINKGMIWRRATDPPFGAFSGMNNLVSNTMNLHIGFWQNIAWRCQRCQFVMVDHSRLVKIKK